MCHATRNDSDVAGSHRSLDTCDVQDTVSSKERHREIVRHVAMRRLTTPHLDEVDARPRGASDLVFANVGPRLERVASGQLVDVAIHVRQEHVGQRYGRRAANHAKESEHYAGAHAASVRHPPPAGNLRVTRRVTHFSLDARARALRLCGTTLEVARKMLADPMSVERMLTAAFLASLAIAIAFGPELRRILVRMRSRRAADVTPDAPGLGVEPQ